jgi:serine phosphatase RsbU (regulator of sigma subunit)
VTSGAPADDDPGKGVLSDPARVEALALTGLTAESDPVMESFAGRVRRWLDVPVALVSLVGPDQQVFPGMVGLPEPWASRRSTPLSHSFCQHVVISAEPLAVPDAREHPLVRENLAVPELGVVAYLGMPLTDETGLVLGALCAIDTRPRQWTDDEFRLLRDLAYGCSVELRLRLAKVDAQHERDRRDELDAALQRSFDLSQTLLSASQAFTDTATVEDVRVRIGELVDSELRPSYVGLSVLDPDTGELRRLPDPKSAPGAEDESPWSRYGLDSPLLSAAAVREQRVVHHADRASFDADHPGPVRELLRELGVHAVLAAPLRGPDRPLGAIVLGWSAPRALPTHDLVVVTTIAGYAAQALHRAQILQERWSVAHRLQQAMLTTLPELPELPMAAAYRPADSREDVGGDWYDAFTQPDPRHPDEQHAVVSVGDIVGHELRAATVMGQVRSMLRQAAWDHPDRPPSQILSAFEHANEGLGLHASGTAVLAHLHRSAAGPWSLRWTNSGHPPPVLIGPTGGTELLDRHDILFGLVRPPDSRRDDVRTVPAGSTLFVYTDGLVERRDADLDTGIDRLLALLADRAGQAPREIVDSAVDELGGTDDDVVALAIGFGQPGQL